MATSSGEIVQLHRGVPGVPHSDETRTRCFILYATEGGRNCASVEKLIAEELEGTKDVVPTRQVIADWARDEGWSAQADALWRSTKLWGVRELQTIALANALLGQRRRHEVLLGKYKDNNDIAAQYLKSGELADRFIERVLPLSAMKPPADDAPDTEELPRDEREALARQALVQR